MAKKDNKSTDPIKEISFLDKLLAAGAINATTIATAIENNYKAQVELNKVFGQGQERLVELMGSISNAIPTISRLGGSVTDVQKIMSEVALASRRNVVANTEDVEKLYAATQIIGGSAEDLSNSFLNIGVGISEMPKQLEDSINYIQSIGGNAEQVMKDVTSNMDKMNRFQFEGGVQGLTKMAAQASMLRFNMQETFNLADKVLDPENAIEVASAFQRLGVSAGNLVDPFQLMNMSINDPSGLQDSLADVAKQFTYFDEKTKTFKINPQGVLTLREMERQTGVSAAEMSKMALAAAELDQRLEAVDMANLSIKEEDKQYLANIAKMEGGTYKVSLADGTKKELADLSQPEFEKLIEQQKTGPKTLEEIALKQLSVDESMLNAVKTMAENFKQGIAGSRQVRQGVASVARTTQTVLNETTDKFKVEDFRDFTEGILGGLETAIKDGFVGKKPFGDILSEGLENFGNKFEDFGEKIRESLRQAAESASQKISPQNSGEKFIKEKLEDVSKTDFLNPKGNVSNISPQTIESRMKDIQVVQNTNTIQTTKGNVDVGGKIQIELIAPAGVSTEQLKQYVDASFNSPQFKNYIKTQTKPQSPLSAPESNSFA
jgi:hypothetical protein